MDNNTTEILERLQRLINDFAPSTMGWVRHLIYAQREASTGAFKAKLAAKLPF